MLCGLVSRVTSCLKIWKFNTVDFLCFTDVVGGEFWRVRVRVSLSADVSDISWTIQIAGNFIHLILCIKCISKAGGLSGLVDR